jgi:hypothetical protein
MVVRHYTDDGTLAEHLAFWLRRTGSEREAMDALCQALRLTRGFKLTRVADRVMYETPEGLFELATIQVRVTKGQRELDPDYFKPSKLTPDQMAALDPDSSAPAPMGENKSEPPKEPRRKPVFKELIKPRIEQRVRDEGLFDTLDALVDWTSQLLVDEERDPVHPDTLEIWFKPYVGEWFTLEGKRRKLKGVFD